MEPYYVLIMCQRKTSYLKDKKKVKETVNIIEHYVYHYFETTNVIIEYLVRPYGKNKSVYDADYKFWFEPSSNKTHVRINSYAFIQKNRDKYDMVMLQTCPLLCFKQNIKYLPLIMKDNGVMTIKTFQPLDTQSRRDTLDDPRLDIPCIRDEIEKYFYTKNGYIFNLNSKED